MKKTIQESLTDKILSKIYILLNKGQYDSINNIVSKYKGKFTDEEAAEIKKQMRQSKEVLDQIEKNIDKW